jgi:predicted nucleotidyltransferase
MLKIFNDLEPFFKDNYRQISVREYARIKKVSPPTASTLLNKFSKEGLLQKEKDRNYIFYSTNIESRVFITLSQAYWYMQFKKIGLLEYLDKKLIDPTIVLFGSFSKAEVHPESDIDLAVFTISENSVNLSKFEGKLKREIQLFIFSKKEDIKNKHLLNNILKGFTLFGSW